MATRVRAAFARSRFMFTRPAAWQNRNSTELELAMHFGSGYGILWFLFGPRGRSL